MDLNDTKIQVALIAGGAALFGAVLGGMLGAVGSWTVARSARKGAREARLLEKLLLTAEELATKGARHAQDLANQFKAVQARALASPRDTGGFLELKTTDPLEDLVNTLYLVARQETAEAAERFYQMLVWLMATYRHNPSERVVEGQLLVLSDQQVARFDHDHVQLTALKTTFMDKVRIELGQRSLSPRRWPWRRRP